MSIAAMKQALEESVDMVRNEYESNWRHGIPTRKAQLDSLKDGVKAHEQAITSLRQAIAEAEAERNFCTRCGKRTADLTTIHTCTPPLNAERVWVGLTDDEIKDLHTKWNDEVLWDNWNYERAIEAKLKEKNA